jgi:hypothetical protein
MHSASPSDLQMPTAALAATVAITLVIVFIAASAAYSVGLVRSHRLTSSIAVYKDPFAGFRPCLIKIPSCLSLDDTPARPCLLSMKGCGDGPFELLDIRPPQCGRTLAECDRQRAKEHELEAMRDR